MSVQFVFEDDNFGRRSLCERRKFSYAAHVPERRAMVERRSVSKRRKSIRGRVERSWLDTNTIHMLSK